MKLSALGTDQALDVLCELSPCIANMMGDEEIISALEKIMPKETEDGQEEDGFSFGLKMLGGIGGIIPMLLKTHRADVYGILAVTNEKSVEEIAAQPVMDTIRQVKEAFSDEDLIAFFKSFVRRGKSEPSAPSADSPG